MPLFAGSGKTAELCGVWGSAVSINFGDPGFYGLWFLAVDAETNWMAALFERADGHELVWRMRYRKGGEPFDTQDEKHWYRQKASPDKSIESVLEHVRLIARVVFDDVDRDRQLVELLKGDKSIEQFVEELKKYPWAHYKVVSKEQFEKWTQG